LQHKCYTDSCGTSKEINKNIFHRAVERGQTPLHGGEIQPPTEEVKTTIITVKFDYLRRIQMTRYNRVKKETLWEEMDATSSRVRHLENRILR
jgi:hypothetical protein